MGIAHRPPDEDGILFHARDWRPFVRSAGAAFAPQGLLEVVHQQGQDALGVDVGDRLATVVQDADDAGRTLCLDGHAVAHRRQRLGAEEARALGLCDKVVAKGQGLAAARAMAAGIAARSAFATLAPVASAAWSSAARTRCRCAKRNACRWRCSR